MTILVWGCIEERTYIDHLVSCRKLLHGRGILYMWKRVHKPASPWGATSTEEMKEWVKEWMVVLIIFFFADNTFLMDFLKIIFISIWRRRKKKRREGESGKGMAEKQHPTSSFLCLVPGSVKKCRRDPSFPGHTLRRGRGSPWPRASQTFRFGGGGWSETFSRSPCRQDFAVNPSLKDTGSESIVLLVTHNMEFLPYCDRCSLIFIYLFFLIYMCILLK